jgi:hypothetical protein
MVILCPDEFEPAKYRRGKRYTSADSCNGGADRNRDTAYDGGCGALSRSFQTTAHGLLVSLVRSHGGHRDGTDGSYQARHGQNSSHFSGGCADKSHPDTSSNASSGGVPLGECHCSAKGVILWLGNSG